jgi:hypothetical protein
MEVIDSMETRGELPICTLEDASRIQIISYPRNCVLTSKKIGKAPQLHSGGIVKHIDL